MAAGKPLRGAFMILHTPFTADGAVDWEDLEREVAFVDRAGCQGIVWPQGSSGVATLTKDERLRGMEVLAKAVQGRKVALVLGVQGRDTAEMLEYAARAEALAPDAVIAMPPTSAASLDDYRELLPRARAGREAPGDPADERRRAQPRAAGRSDRRARARVPELRLCERGERARPRPHA